MAASYSDVLKHIQQRYPTDPQINLVIHPGWSNDFKSKVNGSVTWSPDRQWSTTLYFNRYGNHQNYLANHYDNYTTAGTGRLPPWILYNASVSWLPTEKVSLSFQVSNLFNKMPPLDRSYPGTTGWAYDAQVYNPFGRTMYLEAKYSFGKHH